MSVNELQERVQYDIRYQKMLKEIKIEIEIEIEEEEERRYLEENRCVMRNIQRRVLLRKDYELEKQDMFSKRELEIETEEEERRSLGENRRAMRNV